LLTLEKIRDDLEEIVKYETNLFLLQDAICNLIIINDLIRKGEVWNG
jgi:hypothetical protein